jgi:hypothetical protein
MFQVRGRFVFTGRLARSATMKVYVIQKITFVMVLVCAALLAVAAPAGAVPVLSFGEWEVGGIPPNSTVGWEFMTNSAITVTHLGFFDHGLPGLADAHEVGIWNSDGGLLATATVSAGVSDPLVAGFRYTEIAPITLAAGGNFVIAAYSNGNDPFVGLVSGLATDPAITYLGGRRGTGSFALPLTSPTGVTQSIFGPNFQIGDPVPEPGTLVLLGLGLTGAAALRRRSRKSKS